MSNKGNKEKILFIGLILSSMLSSVNLAYSTNTELKHVHAEIQHLQTILSQTHQKQIDLQQQLKIIEISLAKLNQEIVRIESAELQEQRKLKQLNNQVAILQTNINNQRNVLAKQVYGAYQLGKINEVKIVLNQENPETLSRYLGYYRYITKARVNLMNSIKKSLVEVTLTIQSIDQHKQSLQYLLELKQREQTQLLAAQKIRQQLMLQLAAEEQTKEQQLKTLFANQKELEAAVAEAISHPIKLEEMRSFSQSQGKLTWPVKGTIVSAFGSPLDVGNQRLSGVIIQAPYGNPVHAISSGKVIFANWLRGFGLLVIINHGNGYMSLYARNGTLAVSVGDRIKSGDIIATIGNTGGYKLPSLYFEIRQNGIPINPSQWCRYT